MFHKRGKLPEFKVNNFLSARSFFKRSQADSHIIWPVIKLYLDR